MNFFFDRRVADFKGHRIEVQGVNRFFSGLVYSLHVDGNVVAEVQNFLKIPMHREIAARVTIDGLEHDIVVAVNQHLFHTDYDMTIDGETIPLVRES